MDCHFRDLPDFQSSEARLMTASAVHKLSEYCPGTSLALRFLCSWLNVLLKLSLIVPRNSGNRANPDLKITVHKKLLIK